MLVPNCFTACMFFGFLGACTWELKRKVIYVLCLSLAKGGVYVRNKRGRENKTEGVARQDNSQ